MRNKSLETACFAVCIAMTCNAALAQDPAGEYTKRLKIAQSIDPHGPTPFGEQINPYTGDLTFTQVDLTLEGIGPPIRIVRNLASAMVSDGNRTPYSMGDWVLSVPRIETLTHAPPYELWQVTAPGAQWDVATADPNDRYKRCTFFNRPAFHESLDDPNKGWNGMELVTEDGNRQSILKRDPATNTRQPSIPEASLFPAVTQSNWQLGCLAQTSNGETGEAFLAVSPDGTKYWLDHLVGSQAYMIKEQDPYGSGQPLRQGRMFAQLYATTVKDRFGNWVKYHYSGSELDYIDASDGRYVDITWSHDNGVAVISDIVAMPGSMTPRSWHYTYSYLMSPTGQPPITKLIDVRLPDQTHWTFALDGLGIQFSDPKLSICQWDSPPTFERTTSGLYTPTASVTSTIVHPSGLTGTFTVAGVWHARSYVASDCVASPGPPGSHSEEVPPLFGSYSLRTKQFSGPGVQPQTWTYNYSPAVGSLARTACASTGTCVETKWVDVNQPDGSRTRHTYSTRWGTNEGKEVQVEYYDAGGQLLRTEIKHYANADRGPWPAHLGSTMMEGGNSEKQETLTPLDWMEVLQQGRTFRSEVVTFDSFGRPVQTTRSSTTP